MKLRNKKTGNIGDFDINHVAANTDYIVLERNDVPYYGLKVECESLLFYNSLDKLNEEWEDYNPKEPLIKNEKIRKAVRVWAEANYYEPDYEVEYDSSLYRLNSWQKCIEFNHKIKGLENRKKYTIEDLCGSEE